jgi:hypothetical protein
MTNQTNPPPREDARKPVRDRDLLFGILLVLGSAALVVYAVNLSQAAMRAREIGFYLTPGFSILLVAVALLVLGGALALTARRQGGDFRWLAPRAFFERWRAASSLRTAVLFGLLFLYMCVFWERVPGTRVPAPFTVTTFLFLAAALGLFRAARPRTIFVISAATALLIDFVFRRLAQLPLP